MTRNEYANRSAAYADTEERRYLAAMAKFCLSRGLSNLAASYAFGAYRDCPKGCGCAGCESTRLERVEERKGADKRRRAVAA